MISKNEIYMYILIIKILTHIEILQKILNVNLLYVKNNIMILININY